NVDYSLTQGPITLPAQGTYSWRVRAINRIGAPGVWSAVRTIVYDTVPPGVPTVTAPADNMLITNTLKPTFNWTAVSGATGYELEIASNSSFGNQVFIKSDIGAVATFAMTTALQQGTYYWRMRAK